MKTLKCVQNCLFQLCSPLQERRTGAPVHQLLQHDQWEKGQTIVGRCADSLSAASALASNPPLISPGWSRPSLDNKFEAPVWLPSGLSVRLGGLPCSGGGACGSVWWSQLLFCCGSSGGFMLCLASVMDHFWCAEPVSNLVTRHILNTSPCHLHNIRQPWKDHVSHKFAHPHFTPGSNDDSSLST